MNRLTRASFFPLLTVLIVASATATFGGAPAGSCWWRIRSDPPATGSMKVTYKVGGAPVTSTVSTIAGATGGQTAARDIAAALCDAQRAQPGGTCAAQCDQGTIQDNVAYACTATNGETYTITANFGGGLNSNLRLNAVTGQVDKANMQWQYTFTSDLLVTFTVRLSPTSNGTATFDVEDINGVSLGSFGVDTTGKTDAQIHTDIRNGYNGLGLGLHAILCDQSTLATESIDPSTFPGYGVRVDYPSTVGGFEVIPGTGQFGITQEMAGPGGASNSVPTMSEWGMAILVALLLVTGIWMMRRRQRLESA